MPTDYQIIDLPGRGNFKLATTDISTPEERGVKSPEWMIKMDSLTSSSVEGFTDYTEIFGWYGESSRLTGPNTGGPLFTSATLRHSDLIVLVPYGGHGAQIESKMNLGQPLNNVKIVRLGNVKQMKVKLQELEYTACKIQSVQQQLDRLILHLMIGTKTNTVYVFDQDGTNKGQMVSKANYIQNTAE